MKVDTECFDGKNFLQDFKFKKSVFKVTKDIW